MSANISNSAHGTSGENCIYSTVGQIPVTLGAPQPGRGESLIVLSRTTEKSGQCSNPNRWATMWLVLLCAFLLAATLVLCVLYLKVPKCSGMERELEELRANHSRGIQVEREKNNTASFAMLEKKYKYLDQYCPSDSKGRVCKPCPQGWEQFYSKCYYFSSEVKKWYEGHSHCHQQGADLVIIESEQEQEFIAKSTREHPYWIGLSDSETEGTWLWADKTSLQKGYWKSGEPDDHYRTENKTQGKIKADCVVTVPDENTWEDTRCFSEYRFICETDALLF
ncbi:CD209 antigen-like protein C isoform X2 [Anguilla anguilla]|uniref:CD209 antigen-like protein C isoform X2 n=1 Tax=Anguilla anguilla TaxID=7936 RepID=UPI0015ADC2B5|nr:CD209 antigen-like protein C isoform X2 [Anguilla anguilla]